MSQTLKHLFCTLLLLGTVPAFAADTPEQKSLIGQKINNFTLKDYRGKQHSLSDYKNSKIIVLAFLGTECPLVKLYAPRLAALDEKYSDDEVLFLGINANRQDAITEIAAYARSHKLKFPILKDLGNKVADQLQVIRTPTVYVLDKNRIVRYQGRIDDQYGVGYIRDNPTRNDLALALSRLTAGKQVEKALTEAVGCFVGRVREPKADAKVTYSNQVARILQKRCVECHRTGEIAPFSLTKYDEVVGWAETIEEVIDDQRMPPWHADPRHGSFANDRTMTKTEKQQIAQWVADGAPEGDPSQLPKPRKFVTGWQLSKKPDLVVSMRDKPYTVPAEGVVRYQYFSADPGLTEDTWIEMVEAVPGNRAVVHHILVFVRPPGAKGIGNGVGRFLAAYVPGMRARSYGKGTAKLIPAGSKLAFQMHYTPIGTEQTDLSKVGMVFADPKLITHKVVTENVIDHRFRIPPHADNHKVVANPRRIPTESRLLAFMPHMHLRGKSFRYDLRYPDGKQETLLDVPRYDFNWQTNYILSEPKTLPRGSEMHCVAHFDNSENNLANPDPSKTVRWGDQTWNEMMIGYFDIAIPLEAVAKENTRALTILNRYDKNNDGKLTRKEVPKKLFGTFKKLDANEDGEVSENELVKGLDKQER